MPKLPYTQNQQLITEFLMLNDIALSTNLEESMSTNLEESIAENT